MCVCARGYYIYEATSINTIPLHLLLQLYYLLLLWISNPQFQEIAAIAVLKIFTNILDKYPSTKPSEENSKSLY